MKICLNAKVEKKKRNLFLFSLKAFFICSVVLILLFFLSLVVSDFAVDNRGNDEVVKETVEYDYEDYQIVYNLEEDEEKEIVSKIEEEIGELPKKDVEILEGYNKEVSEYIDAVLFFIYFIDATFRLGFNDFENRNNFLSIVDERADSCIRYIGDRDILPKDVLKVIEGSDRIAIDYCASVKKYSFLTRGYWDEKEAEQMVVMLKELRNHYEDVEVKAYVLKRICKDLEDMVF